MDGAWWPYSHDAAGDPIVLLIIPPGTAAGTAEATLKLTAQETTGLALDGILTLASLPAESHPAPCVPCGDGTAGRHLLRSASPVRKPMTVIDTAPPSGASVSAPTLVHLSGDIDIFTTARLRRRLLNALNTSTGLLVLDLSQVAFCGAGGLGVLIGVRQRAEARGITLALTGVPPRIARLLQATGLDQRFAVMA
ncbi:anti-anti-sigma factor [Nonomuraea solani]|uniref:Anti-sigma factor antagonist n=1 Tax=Nonomuraea solani TaxID=1144553 RepID=A0A1H6F0J7_9ACTN|nr:anti-anti-sigma factor [Nonomuraea solani]